MHLKSLTNASALSGTHPSANRPSGMFAVMAGVVDGRDGLQTDRSG